MADAISTLFLVHGCDASREDLASVHRSKRLATAADIDLQVLLALGFGPVQAVRMALGERLNPPGLTSAAREERG
jgi:hypothetical protein